MSIARRYTRLVAGYALMAGTVIGVGIIPGAIVAQESLTPISLQSAADFIAQPLTNTATRTPVVMLALAVDEKAYRRAYDDLVDLDGDAQVDTSYRNALEYRGYFDSDLCYAYAADANVFKASSSAADHLCSGAWSGNFLNWLTMTRMDLIRHALYGGHRVVDEVTRTVIERAHVPEDSHAWAKVYAGVDLPQLMPSPPAAEVTFCSVSRVNAGSTFVRSTNLSAAPLLRYAPGRLASWAAVGTRQCNSDGPGAPEDEALIRDRIARIEVCQSPTAESPTPPREHYCRDYPSGARKPAGILQRYGEDGNVQFGLMSRSYSRPRSGGQLRRNVGKLAGNGPSPDTCATGDEFNLVTGQFCSSISTGTVGGIIRAMEPMRVFRYEVSSTQTRYTDCNLPDQLTRDATVGIRRPGPSGGQECNSHGNPIGEIYAETLRYLGGADAPTSAFDDDEDDVSPALDAIPAPPWRDPLQLIGDCADCNIVVIADGQPTFDADELPAIDSREGLIGVPEINASIDAIGDNEGLNGLAAVVARLETTLPGNTSRIPDSAVCEARSVPALSQARGVCPVAPARDGSFAVAGAAYLGHVRDLRTTGDFASRQSARTHVVELADNVPTITVSVTGSEPIEITPTCQSIPSGIPTALRQCAFSTALPGPLSSEDPPFTTYGRPLLASGLAGSVYTTWDDAPYGQGQDSGAGQMVTWCVGAECDASTMCARTSPSSAPRCASTTSFSTPVGDDELLVRAEILSATVSDTELLGFSIAGAASVAEGGEPNRTFPLLRRPQAALGNLLFGNPVPAAWDLPAVRSFRFGSGAARPLPGPLQLAAKYGSFEYEDGNPNPAPEPAAAPGAACASTSWDRVDNATGAATPDCIPDSYHGLRNPGLIGERLERVIRDIVTRSGEAETLRAGIQSGLAQVPGAVFQTLYETEATDALGRRATWIGNVQGLFVDRDGNFREDDASLDGLLDEADYSGHPVVQLFFDGLTRQTRFRRYSANPADDPAAFTVIDDLRQLRTLWSARSRLAALGDVISQRDYTASAATGRHILSFADLNLDGRADAGETVAFTPDNFAGGRSGLLNVGSAAQAATLINWTRGQDAAGLRNRRLDRDGSGAQTQRLGDIVNSEPLVVGAPGEAYDLLYGDESYADFFRQYRNRRQIVFVGANDGMLHAFNAGYRIAGNRGFSTAPPEVTVTEHPLGSELWAYVPFNLLPHLGFLASPGYVHQWTMDGSPRAFDVRAFPDDTTHPGGWGTVLVVGMRLGGAPVTIPDVGSGGANRAAVADLAAGLGDATELTSRSAYVLLDITDPEQPPRLIGEFTDPSGALGMTTSRPAVVPFVTPAIGGAPRTDAWYLVFGNGPDDHEPATSSRDARLFALDLVALLAPGGTPASAIRGFAADGVSEGAVNFAPASFVGDPVAVDWDLNYRADALYFGTSGGSTAAPTGGLFKLDFNPTAGPGGETSVPSAWRAPAALVDAQRPVLSTPSVTQDERGNRWVLAGSGRLLSPGDRASVARQSLFGVIDRLPTGTAPAFASLLDTTAAVVGTDGTITGLAGVANEAELVNAVRGLPGDTGAGGWRLLLGEGAGDRGAERNVSRTVLLDSILFASGYTPSEALCADQGSSRLFGVNFLTGAARATRPALSRTVVVGGVDVVEPLNAIDLGRGLAGAPSLNVNGGPGTGRGSYRINVQTSTGAIQQRQADDGGRIRSNEIDWRETHPSAVP